MNKRAAELTVGTIIIIILGLIVLVILALGFSTGWKGLWQRVTTFGGGEVNLATVIEACQLACAKNSNYEYCAKTYNVIFKKDENPEKKTCIELESDPRTKGSLSCRSISCSSIEDSNNPNPSDNPPSPGN